MVKQILSRNVITTPIKIFKMTSLHMYIAFAINNDIDLNQFHDEKVK